MEDSTAVVVGHNMVVVAVPGRVLVGDSIGALVGTEVGVGTVALVGTEVGVGTVALVGSGALVSTGALVEGIAVVGIAVVGIAVVGMAVEGMAVEGAETLCLTVVVVVVVVVPLVGCVAWVEGYPQDNFVCTQGLPLEGGHQTLVMAVVSR